MYRRIFSAILVLGVILGFGIPCTLAAQEQNEVPVIAEEFPVSGATGEVLILSRGTEYKKVLRTALVETFNARGIGVTVDKMETAGSFDPADYDAVILLAGVEGFRPIPEAVDFIIEHNYPKNVIYVSTYNLFAAPYGRGLSRQKIDAITAASKHVEGSKFDEVVDSIEKKVLALIS